MAYKHGTFVWYENITADVDRAVRFYGETIGWTRQDSDMPGMDYTMLAKGEAPQAGVVNPPEGRDAPPNWMSYLSVDDVDGKAKAVAEHGGTVMAEPFDIPNVGRMAVVADPQGAIFALFKGAQGDDQGASMHWNELWTSDAEAAVKFYTEVFGLSTSAMDMPNGKYHLLNVSEDVATGGIMTKPSADIPSMWLPYVEVDDTDATADRIKNNGGKVLGPVLEMEGIGRFAQIADDQGAVIGIIKPAAQP